MTHPSSELVEGRNTLTPETARELVEAVKKVEVLLCKDSAACRNNVIRTDTFVGKSVSILRAVIERTEKEMGGK